MNRLNIIILMIVVAIIVLIIIGLIIRYKSKRQSKRQLHSLSSISTKVVELPIEDMIVSLPRELGDELQSLTGLVPNAKYILQFEDLHVNMVSDDKGVIIPTNIPLPLWALPYMNITLYVERESEPVSHKIYGTILSVPREEKEKLGMQTINIVLNAASFLPGGIIRPKKISVSIKDGALGIPYQ